MDILTHKQSMEREIKQLKGSSALVEWLRDGLHTDTNRRWFLQPSTLLAIKEAHGREALSIAQDYLDDAMFDLDDYTLLSKEERKVLGPKMAQKTRQDKYFLAGFIGIYRFDDEQWSLQDIVDFAKYDIGTRRIIKRDPVGRRGYSLWLADANPQNRESHMMFFHRGAGERPSVTDIDWLDILV